MAERLRTPARILVPDYLRALAGGAVAALPPLAVPLSPWVAAAFATVAGLFGLFAVRTVQRHLTVIALDPDGITAEGPFGRRLTWAGLTRIRLRYYSVRRDRAKGWMQLTLSGKNAAGRRARLDLQSGLDGFDLIAERAAAAARAHKLCLDETTLHNFQAIGLDPTPPQPAP
jgi:hypothetical protein